MTSGCRLTSARRLLVALLAVLLCGCAAQALHREGIALLEAGQVEAGLAKLEQAVREDPRNLSYRADLYHRRELAVGRLLAAAANERAAGRAREAEALYRRALLIVPDHPRARAGLAALEDDRRHGEKVAAAQASFRKGELDQAAAQVGEVLVENPNHMEARTLQRQIEEQRVRDTMVRPTLKGGRAKPVTLEFRDANLKLVFDALARTTGINFILDKDVRSDIKVTLYVKQVALEDTIDLLLAPNQLEKKILSGNTVLIYPNTPQKQREYQDLIIKSFYLANTDAKQAVNMIKTMLKTKDVFVDEKLNLITMRDTPEAVRLAEKLVATYDLAEPEVTLEMEVLEVTRARLLELGIRWPDSFTLTAIPLSPDFFTIDDFRGINSSRIDVSPTPSVTLNFRKRDGDTNILASPRIRVRNREKARILIGDKVPVISAIASPTTGGNAFFSDTIQYLDVGLKLEVEPLVHLDDDVSIKVNLEVSTLGEQVVTRNGSTAFRIGTRNAGTVLRLKDGETQLLMGLIRDDERKTANKVPGLGDLPILGRLFSSHSDDAQKTEIVLSITPRLVRVIRRAEAPLAEFWSGTEANLRTQPLALRSVADGQPGATVSFSAPSAAPPAAPPAPAPQAAAPTGLSLQWTGPAEVRVGEQFSLILHAQTDQPLSSAVLQIGFDPRVLQAVEAKEADFFRQDNAATIFTPRIDAASGRIFVTMARSAPTGATGGSDLVTLTFRAVAPQAQSSVQVLGVSPIGAGGRAILFTPTDPHAFTVQP